MYCPCCCDIYRVNNPELASIDGAFFGPNWVHMFLHKYKQLVPKDRPRVYVPKIFGFRIFARSSMVLEWLVQVKRADGLKFSPAFLSRFKESLF